MLYPDIGDILRVFENGILYYGKITSKYYKKKKHYPYVIVFWSAKAPRRYNKLSGYYSLDIVCDDYKFAYFKNKF